MCNTNIMSCQKHVNTNSFPFWLGFAVSFSHLEMRGSSDMTGPVGRAPSTVSTANMAWIDHDVSPRKEKNAFEGFFEVVRPTQKMETWRNMKELNQEIVQFISSYPSYTKICFISEELYVTMAHDSLKCQPTGRNVEALYYGLINCN